MMRGRRGIIIGGMVLSLLIGCNNGGEDPQKVFLKSVVSLGNDFLNVLTSFGDVFNSSLGFKKDLKKSDVREYFKNVHDKVEGTKTALNKIVSDMKSENNPNATSVEGVVNKLVSETLEKIIKGANTAFEAIGSDASETIANVATAGASQNNGGVAGDVDSLVKGIKDIVDVVLKGKGNAEAGDNNRSEDLAARNNNGATKLFASDNSGANEADTKKLAADASKAVGAVTAAAILQAISTGVDGAAAKLAKNAAKNASNVAGVAAPKDAEVAGGIVLRAIAKSGKFANSNDNDTTGVIASTIKRAAISALNKTLDTLTIAIRQTIDEGLKEVKKAMNINANDNPVTSGTGATK